MHVDTAGKSSGFSIHIDDIMIDCGDAKRLGAFYAGLLGWDHAELSEDCVVVSSPGQPLRLICQREDGYIPPVWPETVGAQQKMLHLDFTVNDIEIAVQHAIALGAATAQKQYNPKQWATMLDPAGHPFCLCLPEQ